MADEPPNSYDSADQLQKIRIEKAENDDQLLNQYRSFVLALQSF